MYEDRTQNKYNREVRVTKIEHTVQHIYHITIILPHRFYHSGFYRAMHVEQSTRLLSSVLGAVCLSVRPSVTLMYRGPRLD